MADYARIYGFRTYGHNEIKNREEEFIWLGKNCYMACGDYEMLEEILDKEF